MAPAPLEDAVKGMQGKAPLRNACATCIPPSSQPQEGLSLQPRGNQNLCKSFFFKASVKDDAHGLGWETDTATPRQPDHAAVQNLLETAVSTSF